MGLNGKYGSAGEKEMDSQIPVYANPNESNYCPRHGWSKSPRRTPDNLLECKNNTLLCSKDQKK